MSRPAAGWICGWLIIAGGAARCWADGGAVRALEQDGGLQIAAFTSPNPLLAGLVDISVLVQDAETMSPVMRADVAIVIRPRGGTSGAIECRATHQAATNKLLRACLVELEAGWYDVAVTCRAGDRKGGVAFAMEVGAAGPRVATFWPWIAWPAVPVALFGLHEVLSSRRMRGRRCARR
jgi:hypothetical protein